MTGVETAILIAGVVAAAAGTAVQIDSSNKQAKYQSAVADMNAKIALDEANTARTQAQVNAQEQDRINAGVLGEQINAQGGSGLSATSGSFALGRRSAKELARLDSLNVAQRGYLDAFNSDVSASQFTAESSAARAAGKNAVLSGALSGASQVAAGTSSLVGRSASSRRTAGPKSFTFKG